MKGKNISSQIIQKDKRESRIQTNGGKIPQGSNDGEKKVVKGKGKLRGEGD